MKTRTLSTVDAVVKKLGGCAATARITGRKMAAVSNWCAVNRFPARSYLLITEALKKHKCRAPASLWEMDGVTTPVAAE